MKLRRITIDAECARARELILAVASAQEAEAKHSGPTCGEQVPDRIADDVTIVDGNAEELLTTEKEIRRRFGPQDIAALDDDRLGTDAKHIERAIDLRTASGGGDAVWHVGVSQSAQELHRAG